MRWDTGGGALGIFVLGIAALVVIAYGFSALESLVEMIRGFHWWSLGK